MKKRFIPIILSLMIVFVAMFSMACGKSAVSSSAKTSDVSITGSSNIINVNDSQSVDYFSADFTEGILKDVLGISSQHPDGNRGARMPFSFSERDFAVALLDIINTINTNSIKKDLVVKNPIVTVGEGDSSNIIVTKKAKAETNKRVIVGASYDNYVAYNYTKMETANIPSSLGASESGASIAVALTMMAHFADIEPLDYNVEFVLFGASNSSQGGVHNYVNNYLTPQDLKDTLLFVSLQRFGGDKMYLYSDEVSTKHNTFMVEKASNLNYSINNIEKNDLPIINAQSAKRLPYAHWGLVGAHTYFYDNYVNVASINSGNFETLKTSYLESSKRTNVGETTNDTYSNLVTNNPDVFNQMASTAKFVSEVITDSNFETVMVQSREEYKDYAGATKTMFAYIGLFVFMILLVIALIIVSKYFEKKHPFTPNNNVKKVKIAVFGTDYENKNGDDIIIDLKPPQDPFGNPTDESSSEADPFDPFS